MISRLRRPEVAVLFAAHFAVACGQTESSSRADSGGPAENVLGGRTDGGPRGTPGGGGDGGRGQGGGPDGAQEDGFWTTIAKLAPGTNSPKTLFVLGPDWLVLQVGRPGVDDRFWSFDGGATWTRFDSGFRAGTPFRDDTFWFLGTGLDGAPLARWQRPEICTTCVSPGAPGMNGDVFLLRYDRAGKKWEVLDKMPAVFGSLPVQLSSGVPGPALWFFAGDSIWKFAGPGTGTMVELPADLPRPVTVLRLVTELDGSVLTYLGDSVPLFERTPTGSWRTVAGPTNTLLRNVYGDAKGQQYAQVLRRDARGYFLYRRDGAGWTEITPPRPPLDDNDTTLDWVLGVGPSDRLVAATAIRSAKPPSEYGPILTFHSQDRGATWAPRMAGSGGLAPYDIAFEANGRALLCGAGGTAVVWRSRAPADW